MGSLESICPEWRNHWYAYWSIIRVTQRKSHVCRAMPRPYKASSATWSPYPTATCWGSRRCSDLPGHPARGARDGPYRDLRLVLRWINGHSRILNWRYLPYIRPCKGVSPQNMALYGTVPLFWDPGIPIDWTSACRWWRLQKPGSWANLVHVDLSRICQVKFLGSCVWLFGLIFGRADDLKTKSFPCITVLMMHARAGE